MKEPRYVVDESPKTEFGNCGLAIWDRNRGEYIFFTQDESTAKAKCEELNKQEAEDDGNGSS